MRCRHKRIPSILFSSPLWIYKAILTHLLLVVRAYDLCRSEYSESLSTEAGVCLREGGGSIIFVHLWQRVALSMQLGTALVPPDGEMLLDCASEVAAMGRWLGHQLCEGLALSWKVHLLHAHKGCNCHGQGQSEDEVVRW